MARAPKPIVHGTDAGYRKGCRDACCRDAHAQAQRDYRLAKQAKKAAELQAKIDEWEEKKPLTPPRPDAPNPDDAAPIGRIEQALEREFAGLDAIVPFKDTLKEIALFNVRILDQIATHQRYDIVSGVETRTFEVLAKLRSVIPDLPPESDENAEAAQALLDDLEKL